MVRYEQGRFAVKGGAAVTHQEPILPDVSEEFGNPDLGLMKAYQYSIGAEYKPFEFLSYLHSSKWAS